MTLVVLLLLYCKATVYFNKKESNCYVLPRNKINFKPRSLKKSVSLDMVLTKENSDDSTPLESLFFEELKNQRSESESSNFELFVSKDDLVEVTDSNTLCFFMVLSICVMFSFAILAIIIASVYSK